MTKVIVARSGTGFCSVLGSWRKVLSIGSWLIKEQVARATASVEYPLIPEVQSFQARARGHFMNLTLGTHSAAIPMPIGSLATGNSALYLGTDDGVSYKFKGIIDELHIYNRLLTPAEIADFLTNRPYDTLNYPGHTLLRKYVSPEPANSTWGTESGYLTTLDSIPLTVTKWQEGCVTEASVWDSWSKTAAESKRKVNVYTIIRTYRIDCVENGVAWANSIANHFEVIAESGASVILYCNADIRPVSNVPVYVLGVAYTLEDLGAQNIRKVTLTLQEAQ